MSREKENDSWGEIYDTKSTRYKTSDLEETKFKLKARLLIKKQNFVNEK